jgi:ADP-ribosylglycohydrolase
MADGEPVADRILGCLLGGAVGDALGAGIEFMSLDEIRARFGDAGVADYAPCYGRVGAITDDTQMALFTAEGLLRADVRWQGRGICAPAGVVHHAYQRWLLTQGMTSKWRAAQMQGDGADWPDGWLIEEKELWHRRAPGQTCLSALMESTQLGARAHNDSKGCGTVMRVAPVGIIAADSFELGSAVSALTHGHPTGIYAGGYFAHVIGLVCTQGESIESAARKALDGLEGRADVEELRAAVCSALDLAGRSTPSPERVTELGAGWIAEEAVSIARQWVLTFPFELRARLGFDAELLSKLCGVVNDALLGFYERALRERVGPVQTIDHAAPKRRRKLQSGTVTVVQRTSLTCD